MAVNMASNYHADTNVATDAKCAVISGFSTISQNPKVNDNSDSSTSNASSNSSSLSPSDSASNFDASSIAMANRAMSQLVPEERMQELVTQSIVTSKNFQDYMAARFVDNISYLTKPREGIPHVLKNIGTVANTQRLQKCYPAFALSNRRNIDELGHAYARDSRELDQRYILEVLIKYSNDTVLSRSPLGNEYDVLIKDVGGSVPYHLRENHTNVHCCNPILDVQDQIRTEKTMISLSNMVPRRIAQNLKTGGAAMKEFGSYMSKMCNRMAQHCTVRAPIVTFVHSTYNITLDDLALILDRSECTTAFGCMIVDPSVFFQDSGLIDNLDCQFRKFRDASGELHIEFSFVHDNQISYVHKFDTYIGLLTATALRSRTSGDVYIITPERYTNSTWFFRITRSIGQTMQSQIVTKYMPFLDDESCVYIHTWEYRTLPVDGTFEHIVPRRIKVPTILMNKVETAAMNASATNFTIEYLRQIAASLNTMEIISGTSVNVMKPLNSDDLECLVYSMYMCAFIRKMETGMLIHVLTEEEKKLRDYYSKGFFGKLWLRFLFRTNKTAKYSKTAEHPLGNSCDINLSDCKTPSELVCDTSCKAWALRCLSGMLRNERCHPIVRTRGLLRLRLSDVVSEHIGAISDRNLPYLMMPSYAECAMNSSVVSQILREVLPTYGLRMMRQDVVTAAGCCEESLRRVSVPGDGDCFYYAIAVCLDLNATPLELRSRLAASSYLELFPDMKELRTTLMSDGYAGWATEEVVELAAYEFNCCICTHVPADAVSRKYNNGCAMEIHLEYENNHFTPLIHVTNLDCRPVVITVESDDVARHTDDELLIPEYNQLIEPLLRTDINVPRVRSDAMQYSTISHHLAATKWFGYSSSYALALNDLLNHGLIHKTAGQKILDVNVYNGSSSQFYADTMMGDVTVMNFRPVPTNTKNLLKYVNYNDRDVIDIERKFGRLDEFDIVSLNPPHYVDHLTALDLRMFNEHISNHLVILKNLKIGGTFLMCMPMFGDLHTFKILSKYVKNFSKVTVMKPMTVPPYCPYAFVVMSDIKPQLDLTPPDASSCTDHYRIVEFYRHVVLKVVDVDCRMAKMFESLAQVSATSVISAVDNIMTGLNTAAKPATLPVQQYESLKTELRIDTNKLQMAGGSRNVKMAVTNAVACPGAFPKFSLGYINSKFGHSRKLLYKNFAVYLARYCSEFTIHHLKTLEAVLKRRYIPERELSKLLDDIRRSDKPASWISFYETFSICVAASSIVKNKNYAILHLKQVDALRGTDVTVTHMYAPRSHRAIYSLLANAEPEPNRLTVESDAVQSLVCRIASKSCKPSHETVQCEKPNAAMHVLQQHKKTTDEPAADDETKDELSDNASRLKGLKTVCVESVKEYTQYCNWTLEKIMANCKDIADRVNDGFSVPTLNALVGKYSGLAIRRGGDMLIGSRADLADNRYVYAWNETNQNLVGPDEKTTLQGYRYVCTYDDMKIMTEADLLKPLTTCGTRIKTTDIGVVQAAPGCGKTHSIVNFAANNADRSCRILTSTTQGECEVRERLAMCTKRDLTHPKITQMVRTIDSYLMNDRARVDLLLIDEAFMQHTGKLCAAIMMSRADTVRLYGDALQVPFINLNKPKVLIYQKAAEFFPIVDVLYKSYRVPSDIAGLLSEKYREHNKPLGFDVGMASLSNSNVLPSFKIKHIIGIGDIPQPTVGTKVLCFTQAEKDALCRAGMQANTVHEFQGRESDRVWLVRLDQKESNIVFRSEAHAVTAVTRHRVSMVYFTASRASDAVTLMLNTSVMRGGAMHASLYRAPECKSDNVIALTAIGNMVDLNDLQRMKQVCFTSEKQVAERLLYDSIRTYNHAAAVTTPNVQLVQQMIDQLLPGTAVNDNHNLQWIMHHTDFKIEVGNMRYNNCVSTYKRPRWGRMRPVIRSPIHEKLLHTPRNALTAIAKRNVNVPQLTAVVNVAGEAVQMLMRLMSMCDKTCRPVCGVNAEDILKWYENQSFDAGLMNFDAGLHEYALDNYEFALKANAKPILELNAHKVYPQPQTILFQKKFVNAVFCTLWKNISDSLLAMLAPKYIVYTGMNSTEFCARLNAVMPPSKAKMLNKIEFDMKKYDKSQGALILEFECLLMRWFGVEERLINLWRNAHVHTTATDRRTKLKFRTWFQRKSGDASTFFGNTVALMCMLTDVISTSDIVCGIFAGDDSVIYTTKSKNELDTDVLAQKYNLECKMFAYSHQYFCSKFIVEARECWWLVPDPLKRGVKLGRRDLANEAHVEEYRRSLCDDIAIYNDAQVAEATAAAVCERYITNYNVSSAMLAMAAVVKTKEIFHGMFYTEPNDELCRDPTMALLEL